MTQGNEMSTKHLTRKLKRPAVFDEYAISIDGEFYDNGFCTVDEAVDYAKEETTNIGAVFATVSIYKLVKHGSIQTTFIED